MPTIIEHPLNNKFPIKFGGTKKFLAKYVTRTIYYEIIDMLSEANYGNCQHEYVNTLTQILDDALKTDKQYIKITYGHDIIILNKKYVEKFNYKLKLLLVEGYISPSLFSYIHGAISKILDFYCKKLQMANLRI